MVGPVERRGITTKQIPRHQHLERALLPAGRGLHALDRALFEDMEILRRIPLPENILPLSIAGLDQLAQDLVAILGTENLQQGNLVQPARKGLIGLFSGEFLWLLRQSSALRFQNDR